MSALRDEALESASWNLEPLVERRGPAGVEELLGEARDRSAAFAERYRGRVAELGAARAGGGDERARRDLRPGGPRGLLRDARVHARHRRPGARCADPARPRARRRDRDHPPVLRPRVERGAGRACRGGPRRRLAGLLPPLPADAAPLPPAPALGAGGARAHRDLGHRLVGLQAAVHRADLRTAGGPAGPGRARVAGRGAQPASGQRPRPARGDGQGGHRGPPARVTHARLRVQHARAGQVRQGPAALLPALARVAQPRERGERRVGGGPDRGGPVALRAGAALVSPQGAAARPRPARLLGPDGAAGRHRRPHPLRRGAVDRARLLLRVLAGAGRGGGRVLRRRLHRRAAPPRQARRRLLLVHRPERASRT